MWSKAISFCKTPNAGSEPLVFRPVRTQISFLLGKMAKDIQAIAWLCRVLLEFEQWASVRKLLGHSWILSTDKPMNPGSGLWSARQLFRRVEEGKSTMKFVPRHYGKHGTRNMDLNKGKYISRQPECSTFKYVVMKMVRSPIQLSVKQPIHGWFELGFASPHIFKNYDKI